MYSFVIPVYGSSGSLSELLARINLTFNEGEIPFEIVFIEDCGGDDSWSMIESLVRLDNRVCGIRLSRNYGQHNALLCGIRAAKGEIIITLDDDLQHPPEEIPKLIEKINEGFDVVYGPPDKEQHGILRDLASQITKFSLASAMGAANARQANALRVFRTQLRDAFVDYQSPTVNIDVLLSWSTSSFTAVRVRHEPRRSGPSGYTFRKLVSHAMNMMTGFSSQPLQYASIIGVLFGFLGILILFYVLFTWIIYGSSVPGFAFLASLIAIFSAAQLLALGIMGEYLSRMHFRSMNRPAYHVREVSLPRS